VRATLGPRGPRQHRRAAAGERRRATANDLLCQFQADILGIPVVRPDELERTALGVAYLAGAGVGRWRVPDDIERSWTAERVFEPTIDETMRAALYGGWCDAVRHVRAAAAEHLAAL
jgi:glycerol kinase